MTALIVLGNFFGGISYGPVTTPRDVLGSYQVRCTVKAHLELINGPAA
jgi:hypothetical protein